MRPSAIIASLKTCLAAKKPVMLHGSPGVGKSQVVHQVAAALGMDMIDLRLSQLDPVDLRGVPSIDTKARITSWNRPDFLPDPKSKGKGILFLDEINSAAQATQAAAYQLILDLRLGDYILPPGWRIIAAGNRVQDRAIVNQMTTPLKNRLIHLNYEVNNDDWCEWALQNDIDVSVLAFLRFRPRLLNEFDAHDSSEKEKARLAKLRDAQAFATPRTWQYMSDIVKQNPDGDIQYDLFSGIVGEGAAAEFVGYLKFYKNLPNLDQILMAPDKAKVPEEPATLYAVATGLAARASESNIDRVVKYAARLPGEFSILMLKDAVVRSPELCNAPAFTAWTIKHAHLLT